MFIRLFATALCLAPDGGGAGGGFFQLTAAEKDSLEKTAFSNGRAEGYKAGKDEGTAAGRTEGVAAGAAAERERIQGVLSLPHKGHEKLVNTLAFDGKTTKPEAALAILEAERATREQVRTNITTDAPKPLDNGGDPGADASQGGTIEERCERNWKANKDGVQTHYQDLQSYVAFEKAMANGQVRILERKK